MYLIHHAILEYDNSLPSVNLMVDRFKLQKRLWRATAQDQTEFGFELEHPLSHGDVFYLSTTHRYTIQQLPERLLEITLPSSPMEIARIAWSIGNLHFPLELQPQSICVADDQALRLALSNMGVCVREITGVFQPIRFSTISPHRHSKG